MGGGSDRVNRLGTAREEGCGFFFTVERKPIKGVQRRPIYGHGHQLAIDLSQHAMLIRPPLRKAREIIENLCRIGMENMRAILMNEDAREIGRAHVETPVTTAPHVCSILLEKKKQNIE